MTIVVPPEMYSSARLARSRHGFCGAIFAVDVRDEAKAQVEFGIKVAQQGLWKEATYRWEKATQIDPTCAPKRGTTSRSVTNTKAGSKMRRKAYLQALKLAPKNVAIRTNYDLFKEINERTKRRRDR